MINLYFIDGISVNDEPTFDTLALQAAFFDNHLVQLVDTGFYPPHYANKIKLSIDDFNLKKQVNYLSLDYNNKIYYYFIDSINYINEEIYELNVVMDTIQTYMFNIHCENALMERMSISRWYNDGRINRNYIRENIGEETFKGEEVNLEEKLSGLTIHIALYGEQQISTSGNKIWGDVHTMLYSGDFEHIDSVIGLVYIAKDDFDNANANTSNKNYHKLILRQVNDVHEKTYKKEYVDNDAKSDLDVNNTEYKYATDSNVYAIYKVPIEFLGIRMTTTADAIYYNADIQYCWLIEREATNEFLGYKWGLCLTKYFNKTIINNISSKLDFRKNALNRTTFKYSYCPVLLDTNYTRISFGDMQVQSEYPLEYLESLNLNACVNFDMLAGSFRYHLVEPNAININYGTIDIYDTMVFSNIPIDMSRLTNYYAEYDKANKARTLGYAGSIITSTLSGLPSTSTTTESSKVVRKKRTKGRLRTMASKSTNKESTYTASNDYGIISSILGSTIDFAVTEANKYLEPNTLKYSSNSSQTYAYDMNQLHLKIFRKVGYEGIAKYFESVGYKVNEWYDNLKIFNNESPISIRYYFNVIKTQDMNIDLHGCPSDNETIDNILQRFYDGIRLWRVDNEANLYGKMGQPTLYDNVERSFIE